MSEQLQANEPLEPQAYPRNWGNEIVEPGVYKVKYVSPEEAFEFGRYATNWLSNAVEHRGGSVDTETFNKVGDELVTFERAQTWGKIDVETVKAAGTSVEFGRPSRADEWDILPGFKPEYVSNIVANGKGAQEGQKATGTVDFVADARHMPLADSSVGSIKISALPDVSDTEAARSSMDHLKGLRYDAIHEATRAIQPGGYLVWERGSSKDFETILEAGFEPVAVKTVSLINKDLSEDVYYDPQLLVNGVYRKKTGSELTDPSQLEQSVDVMNKQQEEAAWEHYAPIGSAEYEQANQERIKDGKIKVEKFGDDEHSVTLVTSIKVDPESGQAISGHESRPDAESMRDTEQAFADYLATTPAEQRFVVYEGDERVFDDRDEAISRAADSGLVQHLAAKEHIPTVSGEPTEEETINIMERLGVNREELLALYVARGLESQLANGVTDFLSGYINFQAARLGVEGFHNYSESEKQEIVASGRLDGLKAELNQKVGELLPTLNGLYQPILDNKDLLVVADDGSISVNPEFADNIGKVTMDRLNWSGEHRLNEVAKLSTEMRDRVIFHRILEAYNKGESPFVVYGGSHIVTLTPALKAYTESNA